MDTAITTDQDTSLALASTMAAIFGATFHSSTKWRRFLVFLERGLRVLPLPPPLGLCFVFRVCGDNSSPLWVVLRSSLLEWRKHRPP